ncbi:hypothetical protein Tco_1548971 [Tanacetum coccineum]
MVSFYSSDIVNYTMVSLRSQASVLTLCIPSPFVIVLTLWSLLLGPGAVPAGTTLSNRLKRIELITIQYCPGVLGGDTGNGSTYSLNKGPGVLGGDTCDGYIYKSMSQLHEL